MDDDDDGAFVTQVVPGTPAADAGLEPGDRILEVEGRGIGAPEDLVRAIGGRDPGEQVTLRVRRGGRDLEIPLTLAERPSAEALAQPVPPPSKESGSKPGSSAEPPRLGVGVRPLPRERAASLGTTGLEITEVDPDGRAAGLLKPGDVVLEVDGDPVGSAELFRKQLARSRGAALLLVLRDGARRVVAVPVG
jgi:serine protease Do